MNAPACDLLLSGATLHTAQGRDVKMVFVDGRCVVEDGRPTQVDLDEVIAAAQRAAQRLWRDAA